MTTQASSKGSTLKDLVVTAAVATVVSALVSPWLRRWTEPPSEAPDDEPPPTEPPPEDLSPQLHRLLEVPDSFPTSSNRPRRERGFATRRRTDDDERDDLEP